MKSVLCRNIVKTIVALIFILLTICYIVSKIKYKQETRYIDIVEQELSKEFDSKDFWVEGYAMEHDGKRLQEIYVDASKETISNDDFLECCYKIRNIVSNVANDYPEHFTLPNAEKFQVIFLEDDSRPSTNLKFSNFDLEWNNQKCSDELCVLSICVQATSKINLSNFMVLSDVSNLYISKSRIDEEDENLINELYQLYKLPKLRKVKIYDLSEEVETNLKAQFKDHLIRFN